MPSLDRVKDVCRTAFGLSATEPVPVWQSNLISAFMAGNADHCNFSIEANPGIGFGSLYCQDCNEIVHLTAPSHNVDAARRLGVGGLSAYTAHINLLQHGQAARQRLLQSMARPAPVQGPAASGSNVRLPSGLQSAAPIRPSTVPRPVPQTIPLKRASSDTEDEGDHKRINLTASPRRALGPRDSNPNLPSASVKSGKPHSQAKVINVDDNEDNPPDMESVILGGNPASAQDHSLFLQEATAAALFESSLGVKEARKALGIAPDGEATFEGLAEGMNLMPHQLISVAWMLSREELPKVKGGILADEMGLGKTVQAIACMIKNMPDDDESEKIATLILAPLALLQQWADEIEDKSDDLFDVLIYHGSGKVKKQKDLKKYNVVITTHATLALEWQPDDVIARNRAKLKARKEGKEWTTDDEEAWEPKKESGLLLQQKWHRVIIDEAHAIRNKNTRFSRAVTRLKTTYRWCLTGTPIVNKLADAFGLLRFLRIRPWFDQAEFNAHVTTYEKRRPDFAARKCLGILQPNMMRRTKNSMLDGKPLITLPNKDEETVVLEFSEEERQIYEAVQTKAQIKFKTFLKAGTVLKNYHHVLVLLLRLRQICGHCALIAEDPLGTALQEAEAIRYKKERARAVRSIGETQVDIILKRILGNVIEQMEQEKNATEVDVMECAICLSALGEDTDRITSCGHAFCTGCLDSVFSGQAPEGFFDGNNDDENDNAAGRGEKKEGTRPCPNCKGDIHADDTFDFNAFKPTDDEIADATGDGDDEEEIESDNEQKSNKKKGSKNAPISLDSDEDEELPDVGSSKLKRKVKKIEASDDDNSPVKRSSNVRLRNKKRAVVKDEDDDDMRDFIDDSEDVLAKSSKKRFRMVESDDDATASEAEESDEEGKGKTAAMLKTLGKKSDGRKLEDIEIPKAKFLVSTKMRAMMDRIKEVAEASNNQEKIIVFSQWCGCLDLCDTYLQEQGIVFVRFQGDMSRKERDKAIKTFMKNKKVSLLLMSLTCGGVGLNLTRASHVLSLDLAWSPATEAQAFGRVHRLGQTRDVFVKRYVIKDSVEDRLLDIQRRKTHLADGALGEGTNTKGQRNKKLTVGDLANLFGLDPRGNLLED